MIQIAYIEWLDARGLAGRMNKKMAQTEPLLLVRSAGLLVNQDEEVVRISQDYWTWEDEDGTQPETYRELEVIPRAMVRRIEILRVGISPEEIIDTAVGEPEGQETDHTVTPEIPGVPVVSGDDMAAKLNLYTDQLRSHWRAMPWSSPH